MRKLNWSLITMGAVLAVAACSDSLSDSLSPSRLAPSGPSRVLHVQGAVNTNFYDAGTCTVINGNIYPNQFTVGVNGNPSELTDPPYYIKVIEPGEGTVVELGASTDAVFNGTDACQQLWSLVFKTSDGSQGFDPTSNNGGEYQVVISKTADYPDGGRKSDNFKIRNYTPPCDPETEECEPPCEPNTDHPCPVFSAFGVDKFYDTNANGTKDGGEPFIQNWQVVVTIAGVTTTELTPFSTFVNDGDTYSVTENMPIQTNWYRTTQLGTGEYPVAGTAPTAGDILFGNVCTGAGNGRTIGFWSNKNGAAVLTSGNPTILSQVLALPLRKANGGLLGIVSLKDYQSWLLNASATNMAYMLSAQLAAMKGNTLKSPAVSLSALIYAPGTNSANGAGFATVGDVMNEAIALLTTNGSILANDLLRPRADALKTALDRANQDASTSFVQPTPCTFTFASPA